jgi:hypothetical protein
VLRDGGHTWVDVDALDVVDDLPGSAAGAA